MRKPALRKRYTEGEPVCQRKARGFSYVVNKALDQAAIVSPVALAIAQEALDVMSSYAKERKQLGSELGKIPSVKAIIGDTCDGRSGTCLPGHFA